MNSITLLTEADRRLSEAKDLPDILEIKDIAQAAAEYARAAKLGLNAQNKAAEIKLRAERKAGELLGGLERNQGARNDTLSKPVQSEYVQAYESAGATRQDANRYQNVASIPYEIFEEFVEETKNNGHELTTNKALKVANGLSKSPAHVSNNSGNNEWYTPPEFIEAARVLMGGIDTDPASSEIANKTVQAATFYTEETDGLAWDWYGRVWMNPPYAQPLITEFCEKLVIDYQQGFITEACVLVNNATETRWFNLLLAEAAAVCFVKGRIKFVDMDGNPSGAPLQGQAVLYFGANTESFNNCFSQFGKVLYAR